MDKPNYTETSPLGRRRKKWELGGTSGGEVKRASLGLHIKPMGREDSGLPELRTI